MPVTPSNVLGPVAPKANLAAYPPRIEVETEWQLDPTAIVGTERWVRITHLLRDLKIRRGRNSSLERMETGTLTARFDNSDRRFESGYTGTLVNHIQNPSIETINTPDGWPSIGGTYAGTSLGTALHGKRSRGMWRTSGNIQIGDGVQIVNNDGSRIAVTSGLPWTFSIHSRRSGLVTAPDFKMQILEYNAAGTLIATTDGPTVSSPSSTVWTRTPLTVTTLATTVTVILQVVATSAGTGGNQSGVALDAAQLEPGSVMTEYIDGTSDNGRWEGVVDASRTYRGGPYHPNVRPMRRIRVIASAGNPVEDSSFETYAIVPALPEDVTDPTKVWHYSNAAGGSRVTTPTPFHGTYAVEGILQATGNFPQITLAERFQIPVTPGETVIVSAYMRRPPGGADPESTVGFVWVYADGSLASGSGTKVLPSDSAWVRYQDIPRIVPAGIGYIRPQIMIVAPNVFGVPIGTIAYVDAIQVDFGTLTDYTPGQGPQTLYRGFIQRFPQHSPSYRRGEVTLDAVDAMAVLAAGEYSGSPPAEGSKVRLGRVLDDALWPTALRKLDNGTATLGAETDVKTPHLTHALDIADTELGVFFIDGPGYAVLHDKNHRTTALRSTVSQALFGDGGRGQNTIPDSSFETGIGKWWGFAGGPNVGVTPVQVTTDAYDGAASIGLTYAPASTALVLYNTGDYIPVEPGNLIRIRAAVKPINAASGISANLRCVSASGAYVTSISAAAVGSPTTGIWRLLDGVAVVPAGTAYVTAEASSSYASVTNASARFDLLEMFAVDVDPELPFLPSILPEQDVLRVANEIKGTSKAATPVEQVVSDATSINRYWRRTKSFQTLHSTDAATLVWVTAVLAKLKEPNLELDRLEIEPARDPRLALKGLFLEISDRITVHRRPQGMTLAEYRGYIESIEHHFGVEGRKIEWTVAWGLSPAP